MEAITGIFFDKDSFSKEVFEYKYCEKQLSIVAEAYNKLENGNFNIGIIDAVIKSECNSLRAAYVEKMVAPAGKSAILRAKVEEEANLLFDYFLQIVNGIPETSRFYLYSKDAKLYKVEGNSVKFIGEQEMIAKYTHKPETEKQKEFVNQVNVVMREIEKLKQFNKDISLVRNDNLGIFYTDIVSGDLEYNPESILDIY